MVVLAFYLIRVKPHIFYFLIGKFKNFANARTKTSDKPLLKKKKKIKKTKIRGGESGADLFSFGSSILTI